MHQGEWSMALALAANQDLELLGGKMVLSNFGGSDGRRCSWKKKAKKIVLDWFNFFRSSL